MIPDPSKWVEEEERWDTDKHYEERKIQAFSKADWINFDTYIAWVIANAVQKMKDEGNTSFVYVGQPQTEWTRLTHEEYDVMIEGFGNWAEAKGGETKEDLEKLDEALDVFKKRFKSLWD